MKTVKYSPASLRKIERELKRELAKRESVMDVINGLKHMKDDHPCCAASVQLAIDTLEAVMIDKCSICYTCAHLIPPNPQ